VVDYRNLKLISQFITDYNGEVLNREKTGVCQTQWRNLM
jgi:ribosomal protein S18